MMYETIVDNELLRNTILGKANWTRCLSCEGSGLENWNEDGEDIRPGDSSDPDREVGECETCDGLGFVLRTD